MASRDGSIVGQCNFNVFFTMKLRDVAASRRDFTVSGITTLPIPMVYTTKVNVRARASGISTSEGVARAFVHRLVMQTVFDVLEAQARAALLPNFVTAAILAQLDVKINYVPLECQDIILVDMDMLNKDERKCILVDNAVTGICVGLAQLQRAQMAMRCKPVPMMVGVESVPANHTSLTGTLTTSNIIMANWSNAMWQNVMERALRLLRSGPYGSHFFSTRVAVGGN
ncbi:hypothetical protein KIN20_030299 [Parelaphostrongylus tenuis]|uniref:Uncharacterized protein n=1 Tax=Parelaphostrongylus tenuis TaxID=148309 RepID=A0AAD5R3S1_PARTN|nr:hypothetical protein KIN20_030299 [Parelaphostrongylus tenuis]